MMNHLDIVAGLITAVVFPTMIVIGALGFSHWVQQGRVAERVRA